MSNEPIQANSDNATLLLAAAEELGLPPEVVRSTDGTFEAPDEVVAKAFGKKGPHNDEAGPASVSMVDGVDDSDPRGLEPQKKAPAKKAPAKSTAK